MNKMYIAVLDDFPDFMTPTLVAHSVLSHHVERSANWDALCGHTPTEYETLYDDWLNNSFRKVVLRVNQKEFDKISQIPNVTLGHENHTNGAKKSSAVLVVGDDVPKVLKFAKMWKPLEE